MPAVAEELRGIRDRLVRWAVDAGVPELSAADIGMASYEAMANVVDHAYGNGPAGVFSVSAVCHPHTGTVTVEVSDHGQWRPPPDLNPGDRGRGLLLMRRLASRTHIDAGRHGTTVRMSWPLASPPNSSPASEPDTAPDPSA